MGELSAYEQRALAEVETYFREPEESLLGRVSRSLFRPVETVADRLVPDKALAMTGDAVESMLRGIAQLSDRTVAVETVLRRARERVEVDDLGGLARQDLQHLDALATTVAQEHEVAALLEGAGCGFGGAALLVADIPLLIGVSMRVVRLLGACYGIDPFAPGEGVMALKVFELASGGTRERYATLLELDALQDELDGLEPHERAEKAAVVASLLVSREATKRLVSLLLSRKLFQTVPVAGALVGAGFNYMFVQGVGEVARQVYRRRRLHEKQRG